MEVDIECDIKNVSAQDYSLLITNYHLPDDCQNYVQDFQEFLENKAIPG